MKRIDNLALNSTVLLRFHGQYGNATHDEKAMFRKITGTGEDRRAIFAQRLNPPSETRFEWEAYRYRGHWAFGSSAERLQLIEVLAE